MEHFNDITPILGQLGLLIGLYGVLWIWFQHKLSKFKIQTQNRAGIVQFREEVFNNIIVLFSGSLITGLLFLFNQQSSLKIYTDISEYGWWYFFASIIIYLVANDAWFYWLHRYLHTPKVYRYVHAVHHKSLETTPMTTYSFHVVEALLINGFIFILIFLVPISLVGIGVLQIVGLLNNLKSHWGYEFYPLWFDKTPLKYLINSTHHNLHHTRYNGNYGLLFTFWDKVMGTEFPDQERVTYDIKSRTKKPNIAKNNVYKKLIVEEVITECKDVVTLKFKPSDNGFYNYKPGQYITIRVKIDGYWYERLFSLSSSPVVDDFISITVKKNRIVTDYFINKIQVGDSLLALYPTGEFFVDIENEYKDGFVFIAGGSGITPIYSMIRSILHKYPRTHINLLYAAKDPNNIIYREGIDALETKYENFKVDYFISGQKRISNKDITSLFTNNNPQLYVCGPESLKQSITKYMEQLEKKEVVQFEYFAHGYVSLYHLILGLFKKS